MKLAHTRAGSGPPLVLIHALGTNRHVWDPVIARLADERDVIAVDMPGFGDSPPLAEKAEATSASRPEGASGSPARSPGGAVSLPEAEAASGSGARPTVTPAGLAAAVHAHLVALGVERPHFAGNSLGGWVALELALAGRARSVTAIAPAGLWRQPLAPRRARARQVARALLPLMPVLLRGARGRRAALGGSIARPERVSSAAALNIVREYARSPGFEAADAGMRAGRFTGLGDIDVPLTLVWPDHDRVVARPREVPASAREIVLRGCGHMPTYDDPAQVAAVLLAGSQSPPP